MSIRNTDAKVYLYNNDYNTLCTEIYRHQHIETGGNLFGLWTTTGDAVIHVALGPGKQCKRTDVSFYQDIEYLSRVGSFVNEKFMLCHIGEWHSHHHLRLNEPSSGDKRTVRENYPNGVKKFLVIIGNIVGTDQVILSPYYFSDSGKTCEKGKLEVLVGTDSPFSTDLTIAKEMNEGAENPSHDLVRSSSLNNDQQQTAPPDRSGANGHSPQSAMDVTSNAGDVSPGTGPQNSAHPPSSHGIMTSASGGSAGKNTSERTLPPRDYEGTRLSQTTPRSPSGQTITPQSSASHQQPATLVEIVDNHERMRKEINVKRVHDEIQSKFSLSGIVTEEGTCPGEIQMKFKHNSKYWLIRFPKSFPEDAATLSSSYDDTFSRVDLIHVRNPKSLNNYISILLMVKDNCSSFCSCCDKITARSLSESGITLFLTERGEALFQELCTKAESTLTIEGNLRKQIKHSDRQDPSLEVSFTHGSKNWTVELSSTFPVTPAMVTYQEKRYTYKHDVRLSGECCSIALDSPSKILLAINKKCFCNQCKQLVLHNNM